jgi:signal transduction histidine kinase
VVAEALANVARYANASRATVRTVRDNGRLVVEVSDDGVGGADPARGSDLRGLVDRVAALDGTLELRSADGGGMALRAEIPVLRTSAPPTLGAAGDRVAGLKSARAAAATHEPYG